MELKILILDDWDGKEQAAVVQAASDAICLMPVIKESQRERKWLVKLGSEQVQLELTFRSSLESIDEILSPQTPEQQADRDSWDLILLDNAWEKKSGSVREGLDRLLEKRWKVENGPLLALWTAHGDFDASWVHLAIDAGASSVVKKQEPIHLVNLICFAAERKRRRAQRELSRREVEAILKDPTWSSRIVARSSAMKALLTDIVANANYEESVVVFEGEVGTGKTLLAELTHGISRRANGPFVSVFLGQSDPDRFAEDMFGIAEGAERGVRPRKGLLELAEGGTLFVDELQACSPKHLEVLKTVIERHEFSPIGSDGPRRRCFVRFIFATNRSLQDLVLAGTIGRDFASRIDQIRLRVPTLAERTDDVPELAQNAVRRWWLEAKNSGDPPTVSISAVNKLKERNFPDNVRGLLNSVAKACRRAGQVSELLPQHLIDLPDNESSPTSGPTSSDYLQLARLGPRDRSSQRTVFDALVARCPDIVTDDELTKQIGGDKTNLHTIVSRLRTKLAGSPFEIQRDENSPHSGYRLIKTSQ